MNSCAQVGNPEREEAEGKALDQDQHNTRPPCGPILPCCTDTVELSEATPETDREVVTALGRMELEQHRMYEYIAHLTEELTRRIEAAERSALIIDRLDIEVGRLRRREDERKVEPILLAVVSLLDGLEELTKGSDDGVRDPSHMYRRLTVLRKQVLEVLQRLGVTIFRPPPGELFDPKRHEAIDADQPIGAGNHAVISRVARPGIEWAGRVLRPAGVTVTRQGVNQGVIHSETQEPHHDEQDKDLWN